MAPNPWHSTVYCSAYSHVCRKRQSKTDWAGVALGDAFRSNLDYYIRLPAQSAFYSMVKKAQTEAARMTGASCEAELQPRVKPQLGPCYSTYPSTLAAYSAIGLTAFLEFKARVREEIPFTPLRSYMKNPAGADGVTADPATYKKVAETVARWVQTRLLIEDLSRGASLSTVEIYRLFSASQQGIKFNSLSEIIRSVMLYGDVLPDWEDGFDHIHPLTRDLLKDITVTSTPFFEAISLVKRSIVFTVGIHLGFRWIRSVCKAIAKYLPRLREKEPGKRRDRTTPKIHDIPYPKAKQRQEHGFGNEQCHGENAQKIAPLEGPNPPSLHEAIDAAQHVSNAIMNGKSGDRAKETKTEIQGEETAEALADFDEAIEGAGGQHREWEDMRSDLVERSLKISP
ncbi:MAG: hypothetical protein KAV87_28985, partial [Desulfobacteraceae bacterium]|nr:hypothetical protein [Desulfobacteraceae bacterium]